MGFLLKKEFILRKRTSSFGHRACRDVEVIEMGLSSNQRLEKSEDVFAKQKHQDQIRKNH
jgi:hypothetical protein